MRLLRKLLDKKEQRRYEISFIFMQTTMLVLQKSLNQTFERKCLKGIEIFKNKLKFCFMFCFMKRNRMCKQKKKKSKKKVPTQKRYTGTERHKKKNKVQ